MIFSSMIGTSFLGKGYHLRGGFGRWGEVNILFSMMEMSMLASTSPQILCPSSERANMLRIFQVCQRHCWRRPPHKAFVLRRGAPTWLRFSRPTSVIVGVDIPANPLSSVEARQHGKVFSGLLASLLASTSPQNLCPPSRHANMLRLISIFRCPRMK